eukprot:TRINITY_DN26278_c0_g1_i1.p1 TRINITY_DN26278_c0_g1~~TRINITY_DN26278_c0_g1_i1.p1  ORF type:complete len:196 (+),score=52.42 TRINITY_DN26278_c0_g1_i1:172-759(+)
MIQELVDEFTYLYDNLKKTMEMVNPVGDLQHFMLIIPKSQPTNLFSKVTFEPFCEPAASDEPKPSARRDDSESDKEGEGFYIAEDLKCYIKGTWEKLLAGAKVEGEETGQLANMLKSDSCRDYFFNAVLRNVGKVGVEDYSCFVKIGKILSGVIKLELGEESLGVKLLIIIRLFNLIYHIAVSYTHLTLPTICSV